MSAPPFRFDWSLNIGHVMTVVAIIATAAIGYVDLSRDVQEHDRRITTVENLTAQAHDRLAQNDVLDARIRTQIDSLEALMGEVRDELKTMNRRNP